MINIRQVSITFAKKSLVLTLSCIVSIITAVVLIVGICNFSKNAQESYKESLRMAYGDCDILVNYKDYSCISDDNLKKIKNIRGIGKIACGYYSNKLMINQYIVYAIGSDNSAMLKSRYHYSTKLQNDTIVINNTLAGCLRCKVGDVITIGANKLTISEVIKDTSMSEVSISLAIMTQKTLTGLLQEQDLPNFLMIKTNSLISKDKVASLLTSSSDKIEVIVVEADPLYKDAVDSFSIFVNILTISVMLVTFLFVASIFKNFLFKYNHDLAIIRTIGGSGKQIRQIFGYIVYFIDGIGCFIGFIVSIIMNKLLLGMMNKKMQLINGVMRFYWLQSLLVTIIIFLFLAIMLKLSLRKKLKILPLESIMYNQINKIGKLKKQNKLSNIFFLTKVMGRNFSISIKLLSTKMKENLLIISTIAMLVIISFVGGSLSYMIQKNNNNYIKNQFLTNIVVTCSNLLPYENAMEIYEQLHNSKKFNTSLILSTGQNTTINDNDISYMLADFNAMQEQSVMSEMENSTNGIVLSHEFAKKLGVSVGDVVMAKTPLVNEYDENGNIIGTIKEAKTVKVYVTALMSKIFMHCDAFIDLNNSLFAQDNMWLERINIDGDLNEAETILNSIKNKYAGVKWTNYEEVIQTSNKTIKERYAIFNIVVNLLILIAGIGWFNSIRNIILSRGTEYSILRIQGVSIRRLRLIIVIQVLVYLFSGIVIGAIIGGGLLTGIVYIEQNSLSIMVNYQMISKIIIFLIGLSLFLIPTIKKVSTKQVNIG